MIFFKHGEQAHMVPDIVKFRSIIHMLELFYWWKLTAGPGFIRIWQFHTDHTPLKMKQFYFHCNFQFSMIKNKIRKELRGHYFVFSRTKQTNSEIVYNYPPPQNYPYKSPKGAYSEPSKYWERMVLFMQSAIYIKDCWRYIYKWNMRKTVPVQIASITMFDRIMTWLKARSKSSHIITSI